MGRGAWLALGAVAVLCVVWLAARFARLPGPPGREGGVESPAHTAHENPAHEGDAVNSSPELPGESHPDPPDTGPTRDNAVQTAPSDHTTVPEAQDLRQPGGDGGNGGSTSARAASADPFAPQRLLMVEKQMRRRDITDARVLAAMERVPRHAFVPNDLQNLAYADQPLPIGKGQTISQPYIVAFMTQLVRPHAKAKALDVGTGTGYQAAVLAELCEHVFTIEIVEELAEQARPLLASLGYDNVTCRHGDGYAGWPEEAPFDVIVVAAAPDHIPPALLDQLALEGRLVIPVGRFGQELVLVDKRRDGTLHQQSVAAVAFVPMTGQAQQ